MDNILSKLEEIKAVPTELMTEITNKEMETISAHTEINESFLNNDSLPKYGQSANGTNPAAPSNGQPIKAGNLITPKMAMQLFNILIPTLVATGLRVFAKREVNKRHLEANSQEMAIIEPVLANYLNSISFNVESPLNALVLTVAMVYGTKVIEVINNTPQKIQKTNQPEPVRHENNNNLGLTKDGRPRTSRRGMNATGRPKKTK